MAFKPDARAHGSKWESESASSTVRAELRAEHVANNPAWALNHCFGTGVKYSHTHHNKIGNGWHQAEGEPDRWMATFDGKEADYIVNYLNKLIAHLKASNDPLEVEVSAKANGSHADPDRKLVCITTPDPIALTEKINRACQRATGGRCETLKARYMATRLAEGRGGRD